MYSFNNNSSFCANITSSVFHNWTPFFSIHNLLPVPLLPPSLLQTVMVFHIHPRSRLKVPCKNVAEVAQPRPEPAYIVYLGGGVQDSSTDLKPNRSKKNGEIVFSSSSFQSNTVKFGQNLLANYENEKRVTKKTQLVSIM